MHLHSLTALERVSEPLPLGALNSTVVFYLFHWLPCITISGQQGAEIRGYLSHLCEGVPENLDAKFLEDIRYESYPLRLWNNAHDWSTQQCIRSVHSRALEMKVGYTY